MTMPPDPQPRSCPDSDNFSAAIQVTMSQLRRQFPGAFRVVRPLKVGIRTDILARSKVTEVELHRFMSYYVRSPAYLQAQAQPGAMRVDLDGQPVEPVSEANRRYAIEELAERVRHREGMTAWLAFRAALLEPVPIPETDDLPTGGRSKC